MRAPFDLPGPGAQGGTLLALSRVRVAQASRLWSGADGSSALEISARQLDFKGSGTTRNLAQMFVQANWELSAQDAGLRWHYANGRSPLVIDGASVEATAKAGGVIEAVVQAYIFGMLALIYIAGALEAGAAETTSPSSEEKS